MMMRSILKGDEEAEIKKLVCNFRVLLFKMGIYCTGALLGLNSDAVVCKEHSGEH